MNPRERVFALIPAAGKSTRMGTPKLALPLGGRTILEWVIAALRGAELAQVLVVLGPDVADLAAAASAAGAHPLVLARDTPDMRATIEQGLAWLERRWRPRPEDAFLLVPADHPTLEADIVCRLVKARHAHPGASILVPSHAGRRGHPTLIAWSHVAAIRALPTDQGLNAYIRQQTAVTAEVPSESAEILRDLDTPEAYHELLAAWRLPESNMRTHSR